ncbi:MAG: hypothetical protein ACRDX8_08425 [Acidimicrobiales bacterium]
MESQLSLIDLDEDIWTLSEHTRQTGRRGIAESREALRRSASAAGSTCREPGGTRRQAA